jgi:subtilisin
MLRKRFGFMMVVVVASFAMMFSAFQWNTASAANSVQSGKSDVVRVLIKADKNVAQLKAKHGVRWSFGNDGFTTTMTRAQFEALKKLDYIQASEVGQVHLYGRDEIDAKGKPGGGGGGRKVPSDQTPWGIEAIYNNASITQTSGGSGVKVAVLDTGANTSHLDLTGNVEQCKDFTSSSGLTNGSCDDRNGHGTHVSGTILANGGSDGLGIYGVAPDAKLWAYKVLGNSGSGYSDDIANAIRHAADQAVAQSVNVVISMSLGSSSESSLITDAVNYAVSKGVLVVAAAGNSGPAPNTIGYPAATPNAVAVASLDDSSTSQYGVSSFSSRGATAGDYKIVEREVEVSAPGRAIESTSNNGSYEVMSGTSMATPHIAGLAAKIWAANPSMSNSTLRAELQNRAKSNDVTLGSYAGAGDDIASGFGFPLAQ